MTLRAASQVAGCERHSKLVVFLKVKMRKLVMHSTEASEQALAANRNQHVFHRQLAHDAVVARPLKRGVSQPLVFRGEEMAQREREQFYGLAIQYYVIARFGAFAGFLPVSGNLFHHALEMFLKGHLSSKLDLTELKGLGHRLQDIWQRFKADVSDATLDRYDAVIAELDRFEFIRYPDDILKRGMSASIAINRSTISTGTLTPGRPEPTYDIVVEDVDRLVKAIFEKSSVNPKFFTNGLNPDATIYLMKENVVTL